MKAQFIIAWLVCEHYNLNVPDLVSKSKKHRYVIAKRIFYALLSEYRDVSRLEVSEVWGITESMIRYAERTQSKNTKTYRQLKDKINKQLAK